MEKIYRTLKRKKQFLYTLFIDCRSAFDTGSRSVALRNVAAAEVPQNVILLLGDILQENRIELDDGICSIGGANPN